MNSAVLLQMLRYRLERRTIPVLCLLFMAGIPPVSIRSVQACFTICVTLQIICFQIIQTFQICFCYFYVFSPTVKDSRITCTSRFGHVEASVSSISVRCQRLKRDFKVMLIFV